MAVRKLYPANVEKTKRFLRLKKVYEIIATRLELNSFCFALKIRTVSCKYSLVLNQQAIDFSISDQIIIKLRPTNVNSLVKEVVCFRNPIELL